MLYMKVTDAHWLAFGTSTSSTVKTTESLRSSCPRGTSFCESLINVIQTTSTLKTLESEQKDRCSRLWKWHWQSTGFADSLREPDSSHPMRFALVLSDSLEQQCTAVRSFKEAFHFLLQMEERARGNGGLLEDPFVRLLFMLWDRPRGDEIDNEALEITKEMFDHQGDTLERGVQLTQQTKH